MKIKNENESKKKKKKRKEKWIESWGGSNLHHGG